MCPVICAFKLTNIVCYLVILPFSYVCLPAMPCVVTSITILCLWQSLRRKRFCWYEDLVDFICNRLINCFIFSHNLQSQRQHSISHNASRGVITLFILLVCISLPYSSHLCANLAWLTFHQLSLFILVVCICLPYSSHLCANLAWLTFHQCRQLSNHPKEQPL